MKYPIYNFLSYKKFSPKYRAFTTNLINIKVPNLQEALQIPEWKESINEEIKALEKNGTWDAINLLTGKNPVGCK